MAATTPKSPSTPTEPTRVAATKTAVSAALQHLDAAIALLRPLSTTLTPTERLTSVGKLRIGEASVLREVLDTAAANPSLVAGHSDDDGGTDPNRFETELLAEWFALHDAFAEAAQETEKRFSLLSTLLNDSAMFHGARARRPTLRVYNDLASLAENNASLRDAMRNAITYYAGIAAKGRRTKNARKVTASTP